MEEEEEAIESQRMEKIDFLSNLQEEILLQILMKLPAKALIQLIFVSKHFKSLICRSDFIRNHTVEGTCSDQFFLSVKQNKFCTISSSLHPWKLIAVRSIPFKLSPRSKMVGSARGLLCFVDLDYLPAIPTLWNPMIARFKAVPPLRFKLFYTSYKHITFGFGFDHVNIDYKLVTIMYRRLHTCGEIDAQAYVYGTNTGSWRSIEQRVPCFLFWGKDHTVGNSVFLNGVVYWLAYKNPGNRHGLIDCVMGFDVVNEVFKVIELPRPLEYPRRFELSVSPKERYLALFVRACWSEMFEDVWLLIDDNSWHKKLFFYRFMQEDHTLWCEDTDPLKIINDGETLARLTSSCGSVLTCVRPEEMMQHYSSCIQTGTDYITRYTPSLAFLDHMGSEGTQ